LVNLPPLIVRVDVPDATLDKDLVLIHGQQHTQGKRGQLLNQDRVAGAVTLETLKNKGQSYNTFYCLGGEKQMP
jgi:hypothetical protein